jgi:hypothetical protein
MTSWVPKVKVAPALLAGAATYGACTMFGVNNSSSITFGGYTMDGPMALGALTAASSALVDSAGGLILPKIYRYLPFNLNAYQEKMILTPTVTGGLSAFLYNQLSGVTEPFSTMWVVSAAGVSVGHYAAEAFKLDW